MLVEVIVTARTIEQAVLKGCEQLGKDQVDVCQEVLEMPKKGFFGKLKSEAKVRVYYEVEDIIQPEPPKYVENKARTNTLIRQQPQSVLSNPAKKIAAKPHITEVDSVLSTGESQENNVKNPKILVAQAYVTEILEAMGLTQVKQVVTAGERGAVIRLEGDDLGVIIGRRGETLDALQYLVSLTCNKIESDFYRITIDCGNFRDKREKTLKELAIKIAKQVQKTGRSSTLEPMNPYERRIIHAVVSEIAGVSSRSKGEEPCRRIIIMNDRPRKPLVEGEQKPYKPQTRQGTSKNYPRNNINKPAQAPPVAEEKDKE